MGDRETEAETNGERCRMEIDEEIWEY